MPRRWISTIVSYEDRFASQTNDGKGKKNVCLKGKEIRKIRLSVRIEFRFEERISLRQNQNETKVVLLADVDPTR